MAVGDWGHLQPAPRGAWPAGGRAVTDRCSSGPSHRQPQGLGSSVAGPGKRNKHPKVLRPCAPLHRVALPDPDAREPSSSVSTALYRAEMPVRRGRGCGGRSAPASGACFGEAWVSCRSALRPSSHEGGRSPGTPTAPGRYSWRISTWGLDPPLKGFFLRAASGSEGPCPKPAERRGAVATGRGRVAAPAGVGEAAGQCGHLWALQAGARPAVEAVHAASEFVWDPQEAGHRRALALAGRGGQPTGRGAAGGRADANHVAWAGRHTC